MQIKDDGDIVRGLGFVALYAAYLEEQIDCLLFLLSPIKNFSEKEQKLPTSSKVKLAIQRVSELEFAYRADMLSDLGISAELLKMRNEVIHGRIYSSHDRPENLKSGRPQIPDRPIESAELYDLANKLFAVRFSVYRPMILQIPHSLASHSTNI